MANGILKSQKIIKYVFLFVVIAGGLFYLLPIHGFNRTIKLELSAPLLMESSFKKAIYQEDSINLFSKKEDISLRFSEDSRFYALKDQQQIKEISKVIYSTLATKNSAEAKIFFLYNDFYIYPLVLDYYLGVMNISSSSFSYHFTNFYEELNIPINLSYTLSQEEDFNWVYNFDFLIVPELNKNKKIEPHFAFFSDNYDIIYSYLSNSEKFKKNFKLVYQTNVPDKGIVQLYEHKDIN